MVLSAISKLDAEPKRRILLAVVADEASDREAISEAFSGDGRHRVVSSCPLDRAEIAIQEKQIDAIVGFVENANAWERFQCIAEQFPDLLSVLVVTDPDEIGAAADGSVLNAVIGLGGDDLSSVAASVTAEAAREFGVSRTPLSLVDPVERENLDALSDREREVLALTAQGMTLKEIATRINRAYATVTTHRANIMEKLGLHDKVALARFAIRTGLIDA